MSVIDNIKDVADLIKKAGDIELYRKIVELQGEIVELMSQKLDNEKKIEKLEADLAQRAQMMFKKPFYYQEGDDVPFCPKCFEHERLAIHLFLCNNFRWDCRHCKSIYLDEDVQKQRRNSLYDRYI
jgi:hypothetical protein